MKRVIWASSVLLVPDWALESPGKTVKHSFWGSTLNPLSHSAQNLHLKKSVFLTQAVGGGDAASLELPDEQFLNLAEGFWGHRRAFRGM